MKIFTRLIDILIISIICTLLTLSILKSGVKTKNNISTDIKHSSYSIQNLSNDIGNIAKNNETSILWLNSDKNGDSFGTGFVVNYNKSKYVVTNYHVIKDESKVTGYLFDNSEVSLNVVGYDASLDIAVLSFEKSTLVPSLNFGNSNNTKVGDFVVAIGNPLGLDYTTTFGIISAKNRELYLDTETYQNMLQTDAAINPGNSGGPLFNLNGDVIGMNTAIMKDSQGLGFAIPSSEIQNTLKDIITKGIIQHPFLGVEIADSNNGVQVLSVYPNSPASISDIKQDDIFLEINKTPVKTINDLQTQLKKQNVGDTIEVKIKRGDNIIIKNVKLSNKGE